MIRTTALVIFILAATLLAGCATNPMLDHKAVCIDGKMSLFITYGPVALTDRIPNLDSICPQPVPVSVAAGQPAASAAK